MYLLLREDCHIDFKIDSNSIQNMVIVDIVICGCGEDLLFLVEMLKLKVVKVVRRLQGTRYHFIQWVEGENYSLKINV